MYGGAQQCIELIRQLDTNYEHILIVPEGSAIIQHAKQNKIQCMTLKHSGDLNVLGYLELKKLLLKLKPDFVHVHSRRGADFIGGLACLRLSIPAILHRRVDNIPSLFFVIYQQILFYKVICISPAIIDILHRHHIPMDRLHLAYDGIECTAGNSKRNETTRYQDKLELGIDPDTLLFTIVAQLIPRKGHALLFEAVRRLHTGRCFKLLCFGEGALRKKLQAFINRHTLANKIQLMGFKKDIHAVLAITDLQIHPAYREGLGVSLLQGACQQVPLIASNVGGIADVFTDSVTARLVPAGNIDKLTKAIEDYLAEPAKYSQLANQAHAMVTTRFTTTRMAKSVEQVYQELLEHKRKQENIV